MQLMSAGSQRSAATCSACLKSVCALKHVLRFAMQPVLQQRAPAHYALAWVTCQMDPWCFAGCLCEAVTGDLPSNHHSDRHQNFFAALHEVMRSLCCTSLVRRHVELPPPMDGCAKRLVVHLGFLHSQSATAYSQRHPSGHALLHSSEVSHSRNSDHSRVRMTLAVQIHPAWLGQRMATMSCETLLQLLAVSGTLTLTGLAYWI